MQIPRMMPKFDDDGDGEVPFPSGAGVTSGAT